MALPLVDVLIIALYLVAILYLGTWFGRFVKTQKDYFLAGRNLPFWAIGMSIVVSDIGAVDFVSLGGMSYRYGIVAANMDWIGTMPAILLAAFVFVPYYWRAGVYSVPEYLGRRYNPAVRALQSLGWSVFLILNLGIIFRATAVLFDGLLGPDFWAFLGVGGSEEARLALYVAVTALVTGVYTISGGLAAVVYTDVVQLVIMFLGASLIILVGLYHPEKGIGGFQALQATLIARGHQDHFTLFLPHDTTSPYPWTGVFFGLALVLAPAYFIGNQAIVQRTLGARNEWDAKAGTLWGGLLKFCIPFLVVIPGLIALQLYPGMEDGDKAYGRLMKHILPAGVRGLVLAGFLAGMMSSVDSVLASAATIITRDFYVGLFRGQAGDRQLLALGRWVTLGLVVFGSLTSPLSAMFEGIYAAIQSLLAIIQGPTWALLLLGMFWRRATGAGGVACFVTGITVATTLTVVQKRTGGPFNAEEPFFAIASISFLVSAAVLVAASLATPPKPPEALRGLVYRASHHDAAIQDALEERLPEERGESRESEEEER